MRPLADTGAATPDPSTSSAPATTLPLRERAPTRYRKAGKEYRVDRAELRKLRGLCRERAVLLATMSQTALHAMRASYEVSGPVAG